MNKDYAYGQSAKDAENSSLITDGEKITARLAEIEERIDKLGDRLHGVEPREVGAISPPAPAATVRSNIDRAMTILSRIENDLSRIERNL